MSVAAPVAAGKSEKAKKFQSLNINTLYQGSAAKPSSRSAPQKQGLQSLGKIPTARRAPANLPSLKSETQEAKAAAAAAAPPPAPAAPPSTAADPKDKDDSGRTWGEAKPKSSFLHQQSPLFGQEFPSLQKEQQAAAAAAAAASNADVRYGPGPNLRPQTSGNWMFSGAGAKSSQPEAESPPAQPHKLKLSLEPPARHSFPPKSGAEPPRRVAAVPPNAAGARVLRRDPLSQPPSIIDNEKLKRMDLIDTAEDDWTKSDESFDYNKKLASDDEDDGPPQKPQAPPSTQWTPPPPPPSMVPAAPTQYVSKRGVFDNESGGLGLDEEEERRERKKKAEVLKNIERARKRREEEENKYKSESVQDRRHDDDGGKHFGHFDVGVRAEEHRSKDDLCRAKRESVEKEKRDDVAKLTGRERRKDSKYGDQEVTKNSVGSGSGVNSGGESTIIDTAPPHKPTANSNQPAIGEKTKQQETQVPSPSPPLPSQPLQQQPPQQQQKQQPQQAHESENKSRDAKNVKKSVKATKAVANSTPNSSSSVGKYKGSGDVDSKVMNKARKSDNNDEDFESPEQMQPQQSRASGWFRPSGQPSRRGRGGGNVAAPVGIGRRQQQDRVVPGVIDQDDEDDGKRRGGHRTNQQGLPPAPKQGLYERRQSKLPPRLAKQREQNRNKGRAGDSTWNNNGWEEGSENATSLTSGGGGPAGEGLLDELKHLQLKGSESQQEDPPVHTIIFENTNFKGGRKQAGSDKLYKNDFKTDALQLPLGFAAKPEDAAADLKLDFNFEADVTEDKIDSSKPAAAAAALHPSTEDLNQKIASVKKVWETSNAEAGGTGATSGFQPRFTEEGEQNMYEKHDGSNVAKVRPQQQAPPQSQQPSQQQQQAQQHQQAHRNDYDRSGNAIAQAGRPMSYPGQRGSLSALQSPPSLLASQPPSLYQAFQLDGRNQIYPAYAQSMLLQSSAATGDIFAAAAAGGPNSQFRLQAAAAAAAQFGPPPPPPPQSATLLSQQSKQIGPIGTKSNNQFGSAAAGGAGAAAAAGGLGNSQLIIPYDYMGNAAAALHSRPVTQSGQTAFYHSLAASNQQGGANRQFGLQGFTPVSSNQANLQQHLNATQLRTQPPVGIPFKRSNEQQQFMLHKAPMDTTYSPTPIQRPPGSMSDGTCDTDGLSLKQREEDK